MNAAQSRGDATEVLLVGYFPPTGAVAELFATIAASLSTSTRVAVLAPEHMAASNGPVVADLRFPYNSRRPDRTLFGPGRAAHRAARQLDPVATLFFTQHPFNIVGTQMFRTSRRVLWWHEPEARGQASRLRSLVYGTHDRLVVPRTHRFVVASESVAASVPDDFRPRTFVVPFPRPDGFDLSSGRFEDNRTDLVFFGKLASYKGLDVLAEALEMLDGRGLHPSVRVLGSGDLEAVAPRLAAIRTKGRNRIEHINEYVPAVDVASALCSSTACVLPYLTAAGSSTIAIVGAHSATLLASSAGSFEDYLVDRTSALLHDPGSAAELANHIEVVVAGSGGDVGELGINLSAMSSRIFDPARVSARLRAVLLDDDPSRHDDSADQS